MTVIATLFLGLLAITAILNSSGPPPLVQAVPVSVSVNLGQDESISNGPKPAESINVNIQLGNQDQTQQPEEEVEPEDTPTSTTTTTTTTTQDPFAYRPEGAAPRAHQHGRNQDYHYLGSKDFDDRFLDQEQKMVKKMHSRDHSSEEDDEEDKVEDPKSIFGSPGSRLGHHGPLMIDISGKQKHPWNPKSQNDDEQKEELERILQKRSVADNPNENSTNQYPANQNFTTEDPVSSNFTTQNPVSSSPTTQNPLNPSSTTQNPMNLNLTTPAHQPIPTGLKHEHPGFWSRLIRYGLRILTALLDKFESLVGWRPSFLDRFLGEPKPVNQNFDANRTKIENELKTKVDPLVSNSTAQPQINENGTTVTTTAVSISGILPQDPDIVNEIEDYGYGLFPPMMIRLERVRTPAETTNHTYPTPPPLDNHL